MWGLAIAVVVGIIFGAFCIVLGMFLGASFYERGQDRSGNSFN